MLGFLNEIIFLWDGKLVILCGYLGIILSNEVKSVCMFSIWKKVFMLMIIFVCLDLWIMVIFKFYRILKSWNFCISW